MLCRQLGRASLSVREGGRSRLIQSVRFLRSAMFVRTLFVRSALGFPANVVTLKGAECAYYEVIETLWVVWILRYLAEAFVEPCGCVHCALVGRYGKSRKGTKGGVKLCLHTMRNDNR